MRYLPQVTLDGILYNLKDLEARDEILAIRNELIDFSNRLQDYISMLDLLVGYQEEALSTQDGTELLAQDGEQIIVVSYSIITDTTLTRRGIPADAKEVGDRLGDLESRLSALEN